MTTLDKRIAGTGVAAVALTIAFLAYVNSGVQPGENGGLVPFLVTAGIAVAVGMALFTGYAPRAKRPARGGLVAGLFGLVSVFAFWTGLPLVLGAAGIALGYEGRADERRAAAIAMATGALAVVLTVAATVYDRLT